MRKVSRISVLVLTYNEEDRVEECLKSVAWADEIVVVDSMSTDNTLAIVERYTDKIFQQEWLGFAGQRNFALDKCTGDWVLVVDADERVTLELQQEIKLILNDKGEGVAYNIPRKAYFAGRWIKHCGWYPDYVLRLFQREKGRYKEQKIHESLEIDGKVGYLKGALLHFGHRNVEHFIEKMNQYTSLGAEELWLKGKRASLSSCIIRPLWAFIKMYLLKQGYRDGAGGFIVSVYHSFNVFLKYAKLWAKQQELRNEKT